MSCRTTLPLLSLCLWASAQAQAPGGSTLQFAVGGVEVRRSLVNGDPHVDWSRDGGATWRSLHRPDDRLHFRVATFDPLLGAPAFPGPLAVPAGSRLRIVQFQTQVIAEYRDALVAKGAEVLHFLPANALYVRCDDATTQALAALPFVRWVGGVANACKLDAWLQAFVLAGGTAPQQCNLVLASKADRVRVLNEIVLAGGQIVDASQGSVMVQAALTAAQLLALLDTDAVTWADVAGRDGFDMDHARIQGGANYVESVAGYSGQGVRVEVTEGFEETHPDLIGRVLVRGTNYVFAHGHCTAGIVAGTGANNPAARGMLPDSFVVEGAYGSSNHYAQIQGSVDPVQSWRAMLATASWGAAATTDYTTISMAMDDALFDSDLCRLNSMSNFGNQVVRPEAWAKNIISVGGVKHLDDAFPGNDYWNMPGDLDAASIGPASDGRLKPDIVGYYDSVLTSDLTGAAGYDPGDYVAGFSGTSAATPMVAGHVGILQQMFTDGLFGNPLPLPATDTNRFANRPHMTTSKALLCNTARQYPFAGPGHDLTRTHQGWGFPDLQRAYDDHRQMVVLDEYDTLQLGQAREYWVQIAPGTPEFRATMVYADPAALPAAAIHLVNDLDLKVTRVSDGTFWWGNHGLDTGTASTSGGVPNDRDTIECVYLPNPQPGSYLVRIEAASIVQDGKVETPALDVDFALVMDPVGGFLNDTGLQLDLQSSGPGDLRLKCSNVPGSGWTEGFTAFAITTPRGLGFGGFFGLENDPLSSALWMLPAAIANPFHFLPGPAFLYPYQPYHFDPGLISWLATYQLQLDAVLVLWNGNDIVAVSNVDRIQLQ